MSVDNPQTTARGDFASRMENDSYFSDISVLEQRTGVTDDDVLQALSVLNEKDGKIGACVIVLQPSLIAGNPETPAPEYRVRVVVQVITAALFNDGDTGTGKAAETIARRVRQLFHNYDGGFGTWTFADMEPLPVAEGQVSYGVAFERRGRDARYQKLALPDIDPEENALPATVTITGPTDADIWYTTDGSYPHPDNAEAAEYSAPVEITEPCTLRVVAYRTGWQASNVASAVYAPNYEFSDEFSDEFA